MDRHLRVKKDKRVDAYIAKSQDFAKPILEELRARVHANVRGVEEGIKWGFPSFIYKGKIFFGMSAFKAHAGAGFWHPLMRTADKSPEGIGEFGKLTSVDELPSRAQFAKLAKNAKARATFDGFPYSKKNDYVAWINGAKREETRARRLDTTVRQLAEGKSLRWKYEEKKK
jgi:hypothetical protein